MKLSEVPTAEMVAEIVTREGVDWSEVNAGQEYNYKPPKDGHFIIVPKNAMSHKVTAKEKEAEIRIQFLNDLLKAYESGEREAASMLAAMLGGAVKWGA